MKRPKRSTPKRSGDEGLICATSCETARCASSKNRISSDLASTCPRGISPIAKPMVSARANAKNGGRSLRRRGSRRRHHEEEDRGEEATDESAEEAAPPQRADASTDAITPSARSDGDGQCTLDG